MRLWIALISGDGVAGPRTIARSSAPDLVRRFIDDLQTNRLLEDDAADVICDPAFPAEAGRMMARLTEQMRRDAVLPFSGADPTYSEADPTCSEVDPKCPPAPEPAPTEPAPTEPAPTEPAPTGPGSAVRDGA